MPKHLAVPFAVGLVVIAIVVAGVIYMQRGAHIELTGSVLKVRTLALDENSSLAVLDFRIANPSDYNFVVRSVEVIVEDAAGKKFDSATISETDIRRVFEYHPLLGKKFNDSLLLKDKIGPRVTEDRMIAARVEMTEAQLQKRARLILRIEEIDGLKCDIVEVRK
jgi:hypothetical protein